MIRSGGTPLIVILAWLGALGAGMAMAALQAVEPPPWDALSYAWKGFAFWQAIDQGQWVDPFSLPQTIRPPGTILMAYPFGFSPDFRWFYFRAVFFPALLLAPSLFIAYGWRGASAAERWTVAVLTVALIGMPILYQFQSTDELGAQIYWGMVDCLLAGAGALAVAAAMRSARTQSIGWALTAAFFAAFCLMIKPAGLVIMALTGAVWLILSVSETSRPAQPRPWAFFTVSLAGATAVYATVVYLSFNSDYFSADNIAFGKSVQSLLDDEFAVALGWREFLDLIHTSTGYVVAALTLLGGFAAAAMRGHRRFALGALLCLAAGLWFWLVEGAATQVRYFLPFGVMAFVLSSPALVTAARTWNGPAQFAAAGVVALPSAAVLAMLLFAPHIPSSWQKTMGVNLTTDAYREEIGQARQFVDLLRREGAANTDIFLFDMSGTYRSFQSVLEWENVIDPTAPRIRVTLPVDWRRASAFRFDEIANMNFLVFEPMRTEAERAVFLGQRNVADLGAESRLLRAWLSTAGADEGIETVTETRLRLLRVIDPDRFAAALYRLETTHEWSASFRQANPKLWRSRAEVMTQDPDAVLEKPIDFGRGGATAELRVAAARLTAYETGPQLDLWVESATGQALPGSWHVFAHLIAADKSIVGNESSPLIRPAPWRGDERLRRYSFWFKNRPPEAVSVGFGFYRLAEGKAEELLDVQSPVTADFDGHRVLLPLPPP